MTTFTDKELIKEIKERISSMDVRDNVERRAYEIALASLEAEPVAWTDDGREQFESLIRFHADDKNHETLLLRANGGMNYQDPNVDLAWIFWKSSREHMLQDKGEPGKQVCELTMLVKRLASSLKSVNKSSNLPDKAMEYLKQNGLAGNYPVTPDGWISCSERMPNDKQYVWCWGKSYGWTECDTFEGYYDWSRNKWWAVTDDVEEPASKVTHWMPLPEPPQEVK